MFHQYWHGLVSIILKGVGNSLKLKNWIVKQLL